MKFPFTCYREKCPRKNSIFIMVRLDRTPNTMTMHIVDHSAIFLWHDPVGSEIGMYTFLCKPINVD